jgi:hypothetical protein
MRLRATLFSGLVVAALAGAAPALAGPLPALWLQSRGDQAEVVRAFRSVLHRDPHPVELRRYALLVDQYGWTEQDIRRDLAERSDYRTYANNSSMNVDAIITRAYEDILGREPDADGVRSYRQHVLREGWTEQDVREALRQSPEYSSGARRNTSADLIIRRAYRDILKRDPDPEGMNAYRRAIIENGWDEQDVRQALRRSEERRDLRASRGGDRIVGEEHNVRGGNDVNAIVRNAYLRILGREPDAAGLRDYGNRVVRDNWTQADVERALRDSDEYRNRH